MSALGEVRRDGDADDRALVDDVLTRHREYIKSIDRLFAATDRGDTGTALAIDRDEVDPSFGAIETAVIEAARAKDSIARVQLASLQRLEVRTGRLTPAVFLTGLLLASLLAWIARGHRRQLTVERSQAMHASLHDTLTGLPNRTLLADRFGQALRADARAGTTSALLLIDLDRFKEINDTFGHHYGDELLTQIGPRLAGILREVDTVARLGELKIDRSFVMTMTEDNSDALIVHSVVDLGHNLGLTIVAEGVETEQALAALKDFGCDVAQGYHLCRPIPAEAFEAWCAGRRIMPVHSAAVAPSTARTTARTTAGSTAGTAAQSAVRAAPPPIR